MSYFTILSQSNEINKRNSIEYTQVAVMFIVMVILGRWNCKQLDVFDWVNNKAVDFWPKKKNWNKPILN